jgi:hypothetical protein
VGLFAIVTESIRHGKKNVDSSGEISKDRFIGGQKENMKTFYFD